MATTLIQPESRLTASDIQNISLGSLMNENFFRQHGLELSPPDLKPKNESELPDNRFATLSQSRDVYPLLSSTRIRQLLSMVKIAALEPPLHHDLLAVPLMVSTSRISDPYHASLGNRLGIPSSATFMRQSLLRTTGMAQYGNGSAAIYAGILPMNVPSLMGLPQRQTYGLSSSLTPNDASSVAGPGRVPTSPHMTDMDEPCLFSQRLGFNPTPPQFNCKLMPRQMDCLEGSAATITPAPDPAIARGSRGKRSQNFPAKLHEILSQPDNADIISWTVHGCAWRVHNPKALEEKILPVYFRHSQYSSFMQQVNGWGFERITQGLLQQTYQHEVSV